MRREIVECDICGEETTGWYQFKTDYREISPRGSIIRYRKTKYICWDCMEAAKDLIRERRGV